MRLWAKVNSAAFYVYALKDPRQNPARPFYIGKGTGPRALDHVLRPDKTSKGRRIAQIQKSGRDVIIAILADGLTEIQALKLEAELISAFGTEVAGGVLTNSVIPRGSIDRQLSGLIIPSGVQEKAQVGLSLLKDAVLELVRANPDGVTNADVSNTLGLQSDYGGRSINYLAWSILGLLMRHGRIRRENRGKKAVHVAQVRY